ncbi:MAG: GH3 auxin-responsive promoter family protein [Deltaproteobacteria bacterium]|nr:GH3 auxin-responsive promoter family protein [Deltaproteobacteria bacterium]
MAERKELPDVEDVVGAGVGLLARGALALVRLLPPPAIAGGARLLFSKSWRQFEAACADPRAAQEARLAAILARNAGTAFGKEHGFDGIRGYDGYRKVPVRGWTEFAPWVRRMLGGERDVLCAEDVFFYARSSGTTGEPKSIPVTAGYLEEFRHPRRVWMRQVAQAMPGLMRGHVLTVHSPSIEGRSQGGVPYGSITVAMGGAREDPTGFDPVPRRVFKLPDFQARYYTALRFALQVPVSIMAAINPSTLVLLCQVLRDRAEELARDLEAGTLWDGARVSDEERALLRPRLRRSPRTARALREAMQQRGLVRPVDVWPMLAGALCWKGGSAPFYLEQLAPLLPGLPVMDYGYAASEGCFTVPMDAGAGQGVAAAAGHVMELIPWQPYEAGSREAVPLWEARQGERYVVVITGSHGLYRYDMQDVVEVTGFRGKAPVLAFHHKTGNMVSVTGEKVAESHVVEAVTRACGQVGVRTRGFAVAPELVNPPRFVLAVEPEAALDPAAAERLVTAADGALQDANLEYRAKRESLRLGPMVLRQLPAGAFERHRARRVAAGAPDAHVKPPHLSRQLSVLDELGRET